MSESALVKNRKKQTPTKPKSKVGFLSAVLLVVGSSIGAGIFLKNGEILSNVTSSDNIGHTLSIILCMICWIIAIVGILAMGLTLAEICSGSGNNNSQGIIGWVKTFNSHFLYQGFKNFMAYVYLPINMVVMGYYATEMILEGLPNSYGYKVPWYGVALISFGIAMWFLWISGMSAKMTNIQNWIVTSIKFIPLIFAAIIGYVVTATGHVPLPPPDPNPHPSPIIPMTFNGLTPFLGIMASIPAIFFAYDGFYAAAGIQTEMKEPKKISNAMIVGLIIVSIIDILISISLLIPNNSDGTITGLDRWFRKYNIEWLFTIIQLMIAFGIFGILNAYAMYTGKCYEDLVIKHEIPFSDKFQHKTNIQRPFVGLMYAFVLICFYFIFCTGIGFFYLHNNYDPDPGEIGWGRNQGGIFQFNDLLANWTALIAFMCIVCAQIGALINRKTHRVKVEQTKSFIPCAIISIIVVSTSLIFIVISSFADLGFDIAFIKANNGFPNPQTKDILIGDILTIVVLFVIVGIMFVPPLIQKHSRKKTI